MIKPVIYLHVSIRPLCDIQGIHGKRCRKFYFIHTTKKNIMLCYSFLFTINITYILTHLYILKMTSLQFPSPSSGVAFSMVCQTVNSLQDTEPMSCTELKQVSQNIIIFVSCIIQRQRIDSECIVQNCNIWTQDPAKEILKQQA